VVLEEGPTDAVFGSPGHPYTRRLMAAVLEPDPDAGPFVDGAVDWEDAAEPDDLWTDDDSGRAPGHRVRRWRPAVPANSPSTEGAS
jgi:peptide/nickel transport system ATP-binding protein